jgi:hypothetical protein
MKRVIIESPYAGDIDANVAYARAAVRDCLKRGEAPIATQPDVLRDDAPDERKLGIEAGLVWACVAEAMVVYVDHGVSPGMRNAIAFAENLGLAIEHRRLRPATELTAGWPSARGRVVGVTARRPQGRRPGPTRHGGQCAYRTIPPPLHILGR